MGRTTLSYVHGGSDTPLIGETISVHFDRIAARWSNREALVVRHQDVRWSYEELKERVDTFAAGLLALGLEPGERVGIWSPNNAEWVITQFATAKAGLILVNINPAYRVYELEYALNVVGCKALITATAFKSSDYTAMLVELAPEIASSDRGELRAKRLPHLRSLIQIGGQAPGFLAFEEVAAEAVRRNAPSSVISPGACSLTMRSTFSSRAGQQANPKARRSRTTTSSTTPTLSVRRCGSRKPTASASRCRCITASAWFSETLPA